MKYTIAIEETVAKDFKTEANNADEAFKKAYDNFDPQKVSAYDAAKITELLTNKQIIRNRRKIEASIKNTKIFLQITKDHDSFYNYLKTFTNDKIFTRLIKLLASFLIEFRLT